MFNLDDSLTEIDWLNSLGIKQSKDIKNEVKGLVNKDSHKSHGKEQPVYKTNGCEKPSYSYAYLIKLAIESSKNKRMKLNEIYAWIIENFPYYKYNKTDSSKGWKNAVRHNLSLNKVFKRCAKKSSEAGKGSYWTIDTNGGENVIQYPPVKKMKTYFLISTNEGKHPVNISENSSVNKIGDLFQTEDNLKVLSSPISNSSVQKLINSDSNSNNFTDESLCDSPINKFNSIQSAFSAYRQKSKIDRKTKKNMNSFPDRSAFVPYSMHNKNLTRSSEICNSTCEISYLEIDEDETGNGNEDIISKTPALCQINTTSDYKDSSEENYLIKFPKASGFIHDATDTIFETNNLCDSFHSFHQSILDSESCDSKFIFTTQKLSCQDTSFPRNVIFSTKSQLNTTNSEYQTLFEESLGLSTNTKHMLFNASGLKENCFNSSHWLELCENNNNNEIDESLNGSETCSTINICENQNTTKDEVLPSQDFLEMKNHLRCYRFRNNSLVESIKPSSVSTSSTVKSTETVNSKSPACDKKGDVVTNNAINSSDVIIAMNRVSKSRLSEDEDDIEDNCNWDTFV